MLLPAHAQHSRLIPAFSSEMHLGKIPPFSFVIPGGGKREAIAVKRE
jgi:hypothetical protein